MAAPALAEPFPARGAMAPSPFRVSEHVRETADTWTLTLEPTDGAPPPIAPGQFVMVYVFGVGEVPISVSGATGAAGPVVLTVRAVGAVTRAICAARPGGTLGLRGPFGNAWPPAADDEDVVVVGGGIGLAPLRGVVLTTLACTRRSGRLAVLYGARTPADLLYRDQLESWRGGASVAVTVDAAEAGWSGRVGVVPKLIPEVAFRGGNARAYVCGPEVMMRFTVDALTARGVSAERIFVSLERSMHCGVGHCGHCQLGPTLICRDGPVYSHAAAAPWLGVREL